jgi:hypothetical protein
MSFFLNLKLLFISLLAIVTVGCTFDASGLSSTGEGSCGDGNLDLEEDCEPLDLGGVSCLSLGYTGGTLACSTTCSYDISGCSGSGVCGNHIVDLNEDCDGDDIGSASCESVGLGTGNLSCSSTCSFDTSECITPESCGDGNVTGNEVCDDGSNDQCSGTCNADCTAPANSCGDGIIECGEECEGIQLGGRDCTSFGYATAGSLVCDSNCDIDTSGCVTECGNATIDTGEYCDDGNQNPENGSDDFCSSLCTTNAWECGEWPGYMEEINTDETWVTFTNTVINGSITRYAQAEAGSEISISGHHDYDIMGSGCPGCIVQFYWGFFAGPAPSDDLDPNAGFQLCIDHIEWDSISNYTFTLTVPNQPGTYYLRWGRSWEFDCNFNTNYPEMGRSLAVICVY